MPLSRRARARPWRRIPPDLRHVQKSREPASNVLVCRIQSPSRSAGDVELHGPRQGLQQIHHGSFARWLYTGHRDGTGGSSTSPFRCPGLVPVIVPSKHEHVVVCCARLSIMRSPCRKRPYPEHDYCLLATILPFKICTASVIVVSPS